MRLQHVRAIDDLGPTPTRGITQSRYFRCDDGLIYVVKFFDGMKTLVNELIGCSLALSINLPAPKIAFVELDTDLIGVIPENDNISSGTHLGTEKLNNVADFNHLSDKTLSRCLENPLDLYGVVSFDNWLLNGDRENSGNNMIESIGSDKIRYHMVDFSHCFGGNSWSEDLINLKNFGSLVRIFEFIKRRLTDFNDFEHSIKAIESLDDGVVDKFINIVSPKWNLRTSERDVLSEVIKFRKCIVRKIIQDNRGRLGF